INLFRFGNDHLNATEYGHIVHGGYMSQQSKLEINFNYVLRQIYNKTDITEHIQKSYGMCEDILEMEKRRISDIKDRLICDIFIEENLELTNKGKIAICLQEIPSMAIADFIIRQEHFIEKLTPQEFVVIFSIFTTIRLSDENKVHDYKILDITDNSKMLFKKLCGTLRYWKDVEISLFNNVDHYNIQFNICEIVNNWTKCKNKQECAVIFKELRYWGIFLGDFIKAILKINTIANEIEKAAILLENLSLVQKMKEIPQLTLKSIMTNKSLYL
ncbi:MAG: hypothetical protein CXT73_04990, partial [Methanobacteriota archaeon]